MCPGGPTILALWLWSSQAKYSRRQVFLAVKRVPVFTSLKWTGPYSVKWATAPKISTLSVNSYSAGDSFTVSWYYRHTQRETTVGAVENKSHCQTFSLYPGTRLEKRGNEKTIDSEINSLRFVKQKHTTGLWMWRLHSSAQLSTSALLPLTSSALTCGVFSWEDRSVKKHCSQVTPCSQKLYSISMLIMKKTAVNVKPAPFKHS